MSNLYYYCYEFLNDSTCFAGKMSNIDSLFLVKPKIKEQKRREKLNGIENEYYLQGLYNLTTFS